MYASTKGSDNYCESYRVNSLGPKRSLKTQIFGKGGKLSSEEKILTSFARIFERDKLQATTYKGPKRNPAFAVEVITSFFWT